MTTKLGRKQTADNSAWLTTMEHIEEIIPQETLDKAVATACAELTDMTRGKHTAYAWSGGKDSIVLAELCRMVGIKDSMFAHTDLEYPAFLSWCLEHKPEGCDVINTGHNLDWLAKNQRMLFPSGAKLNRWYEIVQRYAFTKYFFDKKLDMIIVGHRKADGNVVGPNGVLKKNSGEVRYSPLANWSHELILAFIHYNKLPLPPIYGWKNGYKCGTHPWPSRMYMESVDQGYREVYEIDPNIVIEAAEKLSSARHFLESEVYGV